MTAISEKSAKECARGRDRPVTCAFSPQVSSRAAHPGVLFVHTATRPPLGADVAVHADIIRALDRAARNVYVACVPTTAAGPTPAFTALCTAPDVGVYPVDLGRDVAGTTGWGRVRSAVSSVRAVAGLVRLAVFIRRRRVGVVHTSDRPRDAVAAVVLGAVTGATSVVHVHVAYGEWMSRLRKWSLRHADVLIAISDFVKATLVAGGADPTRVHVVKNGVDVDAWRRTDGGDAVRAEFGIPPHAPVILTVCRLFPSKGPAELVRALSEVGSAHPNARLIVVGQEMLPGYVDELIALARSLGIDQRVTFAGRRSDVRAFMAAADIFAMPSFEEPFGLVYVEAMAMELPVVALYSGGAPEIIEHEVTGLLSEPGDAAKLAANLSLLLGSREVRGAMGARGRRRVEAEFSAQRMARDVESVYAQLVGRRRYGKEEDGE